MATSNGHPGLVRGPADPQWFSGWRVGAMLVLFLLAAYPEVMLGRETFFHRDFGLYGYPLAQYHRDSFWRGELPVWNPLTYCGIPFLAQWNTLTLYPLSLFYLLLPLSWSLGLFCIGHLIGGGVGMYWLMRHWNGNRFAAAVAGLTFAFNAVMLHCLMWPALLATMAWMPWVIWTVEKAWRDGGRHVCVAALAGTMQMLTGAPEVVLATWLILGARLGTELIAAWRGWGSETLTAADPLPVARVGLIVLLVAGLAAAQLLPFFDLVRQSQRAGDFTGALWPMPLWGWANYFLPLFGSVSTPIGVYAQAGQYWIGSYYAGIGVVALALLAVWKAGNRRVWTLAGVACLGFWLALGEAGGLYGWLKQIAPGLELMRYPVKFVILLAFLLPVLAADGIVALERLAVKNWRAARRAVSAVWAVMLGLLLLATWLGFHSPYGDVPQETLARNSVLRLLVLILLAALIFWGYGSKSGRSGMFRLAFLAVLWLDIVTMGWRPSPTVERWVYDPGLAAAEANFQPPVRLGESRLMLSREAVSAFAQEAPISDPETHQLRFRLAFMGNCNLLDAVPIAGGDLPLHSPQTEAIFWLFHTSPRPPSPGLLDFLSVSHISAAGKPLEWTPRHGYLPWITAGQEPVFGTPGETLNRIADAAFDPVRHVVLPVEAEGLVSGQATTAAVKHARWEAHQVAFSVETETPAMVVISQSYDRWWRATVNGQPARLWRANLAFQALEVPAGRNEVQLRYRCAPFLAGVLISALSLLAVMYLWFRSRPAWKASGGKENPSSHSTEL